MTKEAMFTLKLEPELHADFMAEAAASHRPASQILRQFMRDFIAEQRAAREHQAWMQAEIAAGLREASAPAIKRTPHTEIASTWRTQRAATDELANFDQAMTAMRELVARLGESDHQ